MIGISIATSIGNSFNPAEFLPNQIAGNVLWLRADGDVTEESNLVSSWNDESGNGNDCTASGAARPTLTAGQINGLPSLVFNGTANQLTIPSDLYTVPNGSFTAFCVSKRTDEEDASVDAVWGMSTGANNTTFTAYSLAEGATIFKNRVSVAGTVTNSGNTNANFNIIRSRRDGTTQGLTFNGGTETSNEFAQNVTGIDAAFVGSDGLGSFFLAGEIAEIIIYNRYLIPAEIIRLESYLSNKYNITIG